MSLKISERLSWQCQKYFYSNRLHVPMCWQHSNVGVRILKFHESMEGQSVSFGLFLTTLHQWGRDTGAQLRGSYEENKRHLASLTSSVSTSHLLSCLACTPTPSSSPRAPTTVAFVSLFIYAAVADAPLCLDFNYLHLSLSLSLFEAVFLFLHNWEYQ